jgi:hypothetical protein
VISARKCRPKTAASRAIEAALQGDRRAIRVCQRGFFGACHRPRVLSQSVPVRSAAGYPARLGVVTLTRVCERSMTSPQVWGPLYFGGIAQICVSPIQVMGDQECSGVCPVRSVTYDDWRHLPVRPRFIGRITACGPINTFSPTITLPIRTAVSCGYADRATSGNRQPCLVHAS